MTALRRLISGILAAAIFTWVLIRGLRRRPLVPLSKAEEEAVPVDAPVVEADLPPPPGEPVAPTVWVPAVFVLSILSSVGLALVYVLGGQPQIEGVLLAVSLGALGAGIIWWAKELLRPEQVVDRIDTEKSPFSERQAASAALDRAQAQILRRHLLARLLAGAVGSLGLAALLPIRSLGPGPGSSLFRTEWTPGTLLVNDANQPIGVNDLNVGSVITVFPQGHADSAISQAVLIHVEPSLLRLPGERMAWAPQGFVAFSKVCTHAGCPVGLYSRSTHQLLCPCHQSTFDVLRGAVRVSGPAVRPLPQLPLAIGTDGSLRALGDFPEPVGPGFWNMP